MKLRPKIKSPQENNILDYYNSLKINIPLNEKFLVIEEDFKNFINNGIANDNTEIFFKNSKNNYENFQLLGMMRYRYIAQYGFSIISENLIKELSQQLNNQTVIEVGAGSGFLSKCLQNLNVNILPIDHEPIENNKYKFQKSFTEITVADAPSFISNNYFDSIIMSWPNYETSLASDTLMNMKKGQKLYYCGESAGGCTADDYFFELIENKTVLNQNLTERIQNVSLNWPGIHDQWHVFDIM